MAGSAPTVIIEGEEGAITGSITAACELATCVPAAPGVIAMGSASVFCCNLPAARVNDATAHMSCVAPIPAPKGQIMPPGATSVIIGG